MSYSEYTYTFFKNNTYTIKRTSESIYFTTKWQEHGYWEIIGQDKNREIKSGTRIQMRVFEKNSMTSNYLNPNQFSLNSSLISENYEVYTLYVKELNKNTLIFEKENHVDISSSGTYSLLSHHFSNYTLEKLK